MTIKIPSQSDCDHPAPPEPTTVSKSSVPAVVALVSLGAVGLVLAGLAIGFAMNDRPSASSSIGEVVLFRSDEIKPAKVYKLGPYCWAAWYSALGEKLVLGSNGSAVDPPFKYRWAPFHQSDDTPAAFHARHQCKDAP